jgi:hypothetical protein
MEMFEQLSNCLLSEEDLVLARTHLMGRVAIFLPGSGSVVCEDASVICVHMPHPPVLTCL